MVTNFFSKKFNFKHYVACSNTNLFSLYYEPWHIRNPDIFIIRGIFRTQKLDSIQKFDGI